MGLLDSLASLIKRDAGSASRTDDVGPDEATRPRPKPPTPREHVLRLLVRNDGRITRSALLDEMDVTDAELDRVLDEMEADNDVRVLSHRAEVLVCRPGYEPPQHRTI